MGKTGINTAGGPVQVDLDRLIAADAGREIVFNEIDRKAAIHAVEDRIVNMLRKRGIRAEMVDDSRGLRVDYGVVYVVFDASMRLAVSDRPIGRNSLVCRPSHPLVAACPQAVPVVARRELRRAARKAATDVVDAFLRSQGGRG